MTEHAHNWTPNPTPANTTDQWACEDCAATSATCNVCEQPTGTNLLVCDPCLDWQGRILTDITHAIGHYVHAPGSGQLAATRYDRQKVRGSRGEDRPRIQRPDEIMDVLNSWATMWAEHVPDTTPESFTALMDYLRGHLVYAAHHPDECAWDDYRAEMRQLRHHARRIAGLLPRREDAPCVHCGGTVVRDWATPGWDPRPDGLSDDLHCTGCGMTWGTPSWSPAEHWAWAKRHHLQTLPHVDPDALVTLNDARLVWPDVPRTTILTWAKTEEIQPNECNERGVPVYRVGDIEILVQRRANTGRRGRPARRTTQTGQSCNIDT